MQMNFTRCVLTGYPFSPSVEKSNSGLIFEYKFRPIGKAKIALPTMISLTNSQQFKNPVLAGICRNAFEKNEEPPIINQSFIDNDLINIKYPKSFKEKWYYMLNLIYNSGGKDFKEFNYSSNTDYTLCYSNDYKEFISIMEYLEKNQFIEWKFFVDYEHAGYNGVQLTEKGITEVEKDLPEIPLIGLVNQEITTGDSEIDKKINHAKTMFFQEPQTMDRMRSACEALIYVLEPLRKKELPKHFKSKDVEDFFIIVNNFDVRHNKDTTKDLKYPEQLEWVFYSLLNTINTYTKLEKKINPTP